MNYISKLIQILWFQFYDYILRLHYNTLYYIKYRQDVKGYISASKELQSQQFWLKQDAETFEEYMNKPYRRLP